jgi:O-antigen/teichoic acid export membrane protein
MSTAAPVIEPSLSEQTPALAPRRLLGLNLRGLGKNAWALSDQALISGASFVTQVLAARALHDRPGEFGTFAVVSGILLWCNIFQSTLVTQAHNVLGSTRTGREYRRYTSSTAVGQMLLLAAQVLLGGPLAIFAYFAGWTSAAMLIALIPTIIAWQCMEFVRRVLYTEGRYGDAFLNDCVSYGGSMILLGALYSAHLNGRMHFTGATALYAMAITSALAALLGVWQIRHSLIKSFSWKDVSENWHFGKWLVGGEMLGWASSLHMQVWWAAAIIGTAASADLRLAQILFGPMRVITFFLGTVLPIRFARTLHNEGPKALSRNVKLVYTVLIPMTGLYCLALAVFATPLLQFVYKGASGGSAPSVLRLYAFSAFLGYIQMVFAAVLTAARQTRYIFAGSVIGCIIAMVLGPLLIWLFHGEGGIMNIIVTTLVVTILYWFAYRKQLNPPDAFAGNGQVTA